MALTWVIGSGGLLGGALSLELAQSRVDTFDPGFQFSWGYSDLISKEFRKAVANFSAQVASEPWEIYWAAGVGTMHSSQDSLRQEADAIECLITTLLEEQGLNLQNGMFIFASSAGAIYAGVQEEVISELTPVAPINAYGENKLLQESIAQRLNQGGKGATVLSCRITNLYGLRQAGGKQQGLLTEIAKRILLNEVTHIYVPLETMRDYIGVNVAARQMIATAFLLKKSQSQGVYLKIIASGVSTSVAQIVAIFRRISKRNLRIVSQADSRGSQYRRVVQFRSELLLLNEGESGENLIEGVASLLTGLRNQIAQNGRPC